MAAAFKCKKVTAKKKDIALGIVTRMKYKRLQIQQRWNTVNKNELYDS